MEQPVADGRGKKQAARYDEGLGHAPSIGNKMWQETKNNMMETFLACVSEMGLKHVSFPWEEMGVDVSGNTSKTLWMYLIVCGWEKLIDVTLDQDPKKGFFGIEHIVIRGGVQLERFNCGMFPLALPKKWAEKTEMIVGWENRYGSLALTRRVLDLAWKTAGLVCEDIDLDTGDITMVFDYETSETVKNAFFKRKAKRRRDAAADAPETPQITTLEKEPLPCTTAAYEIQPTHPKRSRNPQRRGSLLYDQLASERNHQQQRLKEMDMRQAFQNKRLMMLKVNHATTCAWLRTIGSSYLLEESSMIDLNIKLQEEMRFGDYASSQVLRLKDTRLRVSRAIEDISAAHAQTKTRLKTISSEINGIENKLKSIANERSCTERLIQSLDTRCLLAVFDD